MQFVCVCLVLFKLNSLEQCWVDLIDQCAFIDQLIFVCSFSLPTCALSLCSIIITTSAFLCFWLPALACVPSVYQGGGLISFHYVNTLDTLSSHTQTQFGDDFVLCLVVCLIEFQLLQFNLSTATLYEVSLFYTLNTSNRKHLPTKHCRTWNQEREREHTLTPNLVRLVCVQQSLGAQAQKVLHRD